MAAFFSAATGLIRATKLPLPSPSQLPVQTLTSQWSSCFITKRELDISKDISHELHKEAMGNILP